MGSPAPTGSRVVVLDDALVPLPVGVAALGLEATWRVGPASRAHTGDACRQRLFNPEGGPAAILGRLVEQPWRRAWDPGDLVIRWIPRSRALAADSWTAPEVPLAEEAVSYEVEVLDGSTVRRTLTTSTTSVTYTPAQQLADRGALLGHGDTLNLRVLQLSAVVGRGAPETVTLQF